MYEIVTKRDTRIIFKYLKMAVKNVLFFRVFFFHLSRLQMKKII